MDQNLAALIRFGLHHAYRREANFYSIKLFSNNQIILISIYKHNDYVDMQLAEEIKTIIYVHRVIKIL